MARVKRTDNSRTEHICGRGNHVIPKGDSYLSAAPGFRSKPKYRCLNHPFRQSELTTSLASEPLAAVESFEDTTGSITNHEELEEAWEELKTAIEEYVGVRQEALDAWEYGNSALEEFVDTAQSALDEVESHTIETYDEEEPERENFKDTPKGQDKFDAAWEEWDQARTEHLEEQVEEAQSVASGLSFT